ncbi:hypothetical protein F4776DRAFT_663477 [Hypoxylon sp. NC0597]|nr:hypothetical protein F4776DRAFT_663477 [Hypoxylon sp. NC0597]
MFSCRQSTGRVDRTARDTITSQSASTADDISTEDANSATTMEDNGSSLGEWKRGEEDDKLDGIRWEAEYFEVDEDDIIRGMHAGGTSGPAALEDYFEHYILFSGQFDTLQCPQSYVAQYPIQWRAHNQVALEVTKYKRAMVLHDLVDPFNEHLMVISKDHAIIQGFIEQVIQLSETVKESWGLTEEDLVYSSTYTVSGAVACQTRREQRQGGLVDIHYEYVPMDWAKAEQLMSKMFYGVGDDTLIVMEIRPADPSATWNLKPGRRLVPIEEDSQSERISLE